MPTFAIERYGELKGEIPFYKLFIDGECQVNDFEKEIKNHTTYYSEAKTIKLYMDAYSNGHRLPTKKFRILKGKKNNGTCFEFKSKHLRYYGFMYTVNGDMIVCIAAANDKSQQNHDIQKMINVQKKYLESL